MINHLLSLFIFCIFCLYSIDCGVPLIDITSRNFPNILSKTKPGCKIVDDQKVIPLLRVHNCYSFLPPFPPNYFNQRPHLPCFGEYEAVISLCDFNTSDIIFKIPESFNDSKTFCQEAAKIYEQRNITYKEDDLNKWSAAVKETMKGNVSCPNLCIFQDLVNEKCVNMVWASSEYLRLSALKKNADSKAQSKSNIDMKKTVVNPSLIPEKQENQGSLNLKAGQADQINVTIPTEDKKEQGDKPIDIDKIAELTTKLEEKSPIEVHMPHLPTLPIPQPQKPNEPSLQQNQETAGPLTNSDAPDQVSKLLPSVDNPESNKVDEIQGDEQNQLSSNDDEPGAHSDDEFLPNQENHVEGSTTSAPVPEIFPIRKDGFVNTEDSYAFSYFATVVILCFVAYFLFHYKNKLLALALEGRKSRSSRGRGRPSSANYSKLHSNLEEAIASNVTTPSATHVLY